MKPFIKYEDGTIEQSYLCHMFYIASLGFNIVPGTFIANGIHVNYQSTPDGIKMTKRDGECMIIPFRHAMHMVSTPTKPDGSDDQTSRVCSPSEKDTNKHPADEESK